MDSSSAAEVYAAPPILFIFSVISAMAVVLSILRWIWLMRTNDSDVGGLYMNILAAQVYVVLAVALFSFVLTIYVIISIGSTEGSTVVPESVLLLGGGYYFARYYQRKGVSILKGLGLEFGKMLLWVLACALGWAVSFAVGYCIYGLIVFVSNNDNDFLPLAIIATGLLWCAVPMLFHAYVIRKFPLATRLKGFKSYGVLTPMACAFLILMVPLALQEAANSKEFKEFRDRKIIQKA